MKKIALLLTLCSIHFFGQVKYGTVEYNLIIGEDKEVENGMMSDYYKDAKNNAKYLTYSLIFNQDQMIFYKNQSLKQDGFGDTSFAEAFSGVEGKYYKEKNGNFVLNEVENPVLGHLIIKKEVNPTWVLTQETKMIENYKCLKAKTELIIKNSVGEFKRNIIAWYCPEIPVSFGPKGYSGLPGLILEFQEKNIVFGASKISLNEKITEISKPDKLKIISEEELNNIIEKNAPKD